MKEVLTSQNSNWQIGVTRENRTSDCRRTVATLKSPMLQPYYVNCTLRTGYRSVTAKKFVTDVT